MPFGLTYAEFVLGMGLSMLYGPADTAAPQPHTALTFGTTMQSWTVPGDENFVTLTHTTDKAFWHKFTPIYALGASNRGTSFASVGLGRRLDVFGIKVMPFTGPALYFDNNDNNNIQFRTGFDITQNLSETVQLSGGYYHISNGQANAPSADIDIAHIGMTIKF
jgi:hypothetical protein